MPTLLAAVRRARLPDGVPTYVGSYGPSVAVAQEVATFPEWCRQRRRLPPEQEPLVSKRLGGQVPPLAQLRSTTARVSWGVELGARYRDAIRAAGDAGRTSRRGSSMRSCRAQQRPSRAYRSGSSRAASYGA